MNATMRGWVSLAPGIDGLVFRDDLPVPEPAEGEIRIRVEACGINFSDVLMLEDKYQVKPGRPFVPGQEISGRIDAAGPGSAAVIGASVACELRTGGFAEYATVSEKAAINPPEGFPFGHAAALPVVYGTALVALTESTKIMPGETVLIHAAGGGVGLASVQVAKALGATVIAAAGSEEKRTIALANGADHAIDYMSGDWVDRVRGIVGEKGVDAVVDTVGGKTTLQSIRCLAIGGRLLIVGFASGEIPDIPANRLLLKRASAIGVYWNLHRDAELWERVRRHLMNMTAAKQLHPVIECFAGLDRLPDALRKLASRQAIGKLVLGGITGKAARH